MAKKKTSSTSTETKTTTTRSKSVSFNKIMDMLAFVAVLIGGITLLIALILGKVGVSLSFVGKLQSIANAIGWLVLSILSFKYIKTRRNVWLWVTWTAAVVAIFVCIILALF